MKYVNKNQSPLELVIDLLLSLESAVLIEDLIYNVETICIQEENELGHQEIETCLIVKSKNLKEIASTQYISNDEFNVMISKRFIDGLKSYIDEYSNIEKDKVRLRLTNYNDMVNEELISIPLYKFFVIGDEIELQNEHAHIKQTLLMESAVHDDSKIEQQQKALKRLCAALNDKGTIPRLNAKERFIFYEEYILPSIQEAVLANHPNELLNLIIRPDQISKNQAEPYIAKDIYHLLSGDINDIKKVEEERLQNLRKDTDTLTDLFSTEKQKFDDYTLFHDNESMKDLLLHDAVYENLYNDGKGKSKREEYNRKIKTMEEYNIFHNSSNHIFKNFNTASKKSHDKQKLGVKTFSNTEMLLGFAFWKIFSDSSGYDYLKDVRKAETLQEFLFNLSKLFLYIEETILGDAIEEFIDIHKAEKKYIEKQLEKYSYEKRSHLAMNQIKYDQKAELYRNLKLKMTIPEDDIITSAKNIIKHHFNHKLMKKVLLLYLNTEINHNLLISEYENYDIV